jgi:hypothetical protein
MRIPKHEHIEDINKQKKTDNGNKLCCSVHKMLFTPIDMCLRAAGVDQRSPVYFRDIFL